MRFAYIILVPVLGVGLAACTTQPRDLAGNVPSEYDQSTEHENATVPDRHWWTAFGDHTLNRLIDQAMAANYSLEAGRERVKQARAGVAIAGASRLPEASASASGSYDINEADFGASARASVSYELDLFGRNRAEVAGARASWRAGVFDQRALELVIQADVASSYFSVLALEARLDVTRRSLAAAEQILELVKVRHEAGADSGFDLARQLSAVASVKANIAALEESRVRTLNSLAILTGLTIEKFKEEFGQGFKKPPSEFGDLAPPSIDAGLPSELLLRRPDLKSAEAALDGANADVRAARAAFFPTLDLGAALTGASLTGGASLLGDASASLFTTLFSGGRLKGGVKRAKARRRELVANYHQSILESLSEVENALAAVRSAAKRTQHQSVAATQAERAARLSEVRYRVGDAPLLDLLDAQRSELSAADSLVQARLGRLTAAVDLFRALGGGWQAADVI